MLERFLDQSLDQLEKQGLKRSLKILEGPQSRRITISGRQVLNFCSNNYLGLADDRRLRQAARDSLQSQGFGAGASRLVCGNMKAHRMLEERIADFKGSEDCMVFSTGYMANVGIISSLFDREDIVFSDKLNHASIVDGILLSRARFKRYPHKNTSVLERFLKESSGFKKKVIITDSVFSMDGDMAPLPAIVRLAREYDAIVMIDEAHAMGVLGKGGRGAAEYFGLEKQIDIQMGTLSKAAGAFGAYCCGSSKLISFLANRARSFIYTTGMPPAICEASIKALEIIKEQPQLRQRLWDNANAMREGLKSLGFNTLESETPIIPVVVNDASLAVQFSQRLFDEGVFVQAIRPPTVPQNAARLRVTLMASHLETDIEFALEQFKKTGRELCLL